MANSVVGVVRSLGRKYRDGREALEIHIPIGGVGDLPIAYGRRVPVQLLIGDTRYLAGLRSTALNRYAWISPDVKRSDGSTLSLAIALEAAGLRKNDRVLVRLDAEGLSIERLPR